MLLDGWKNLALSGGRNTGGQVPGTSGRASELLKKGRIFKNLAEVINIFLSDKF
jgi:hypothetical protein